MNIKKVFLVILILLCSFSVFSQTTTYFTDKYVYKMPDLVTDEWPEQWSAPKEISIVIQFDFSSNIIYYTTELKKTVYLIKKAYPEVDLAPGWKTRNYICTNKDGDELEVDIQRKVSDNSINILFIEPAVKLMSLFTIKKTEN